MAAVMVELTRKPELAVQDPADIVLVTDVEALTVGTVPACGRRSSRRAGARLWTGSTRRSSGHAAPTRPASCS